MKENNFLKSNMIEIGIHIFFFFLGLIFGKYNYTSFYLFVFLFAITKLYLACRKSKNIVERIFNVIVTVFFGLIELAILSLVLINNFSSRNYLYWILVLMLIIMVLCENYLKEKPDSGYKKTLILLIPFIITFSIILFFIDTSQSAMVSAIVAIASLLLQTDTLEDIFNIKVTKSKKQQLSLIKISLMFLIPIIYISSICIQPDASNISGILSVGLRRFMIILVFFPIFLFFIYAPKSRQFFQTYLGFPPNQKYLIGNWNIITSNNFTKKDIIIRKSYINIDGGRIKYFDKTFFLDEDFIIFNDKEEKIGCIEKVNDNKINLIIENHKTIKLIKIGSDEYRKFNPCHEKNGAKFYNKKFSEPITNNELEVTIFLRHNDENYFLETNSETNHTYELNDGQFIQIEKDQRSDFQNLSELGIYESDSFN